MRRLTLLCLFLFYTLPGSTQSSSGQPDTFPELVNPWIGTTQTKTTTFWGAEGGTYPGAVAPFGFMQLTPETRSTDPGGYDYRDSTIFFFSCTGHRSGYPNGSAGSIRVMPLTGEIKEAKKLYGRPFSHRDEAASPGYYSVRFMDDGTVAEATASPRAGFFRFTFPANTKPRLYLGEMGNIRFLPSGRVEGSKLNTVVLTNREFIEKEEMDGGVILTFPASDREANSLLVKISSSVNDIGSSGKNLLKELPGWDFDSFRSANRKRWQDQLSVVEIKDSPTDRKTVFYTALYHSFLLPWVISDVDGYYRGQDGSVQRAKGKNQYSGFSTWDTFRTLHPLLCLLAPDRQNDMILSMLDEFSQSGKLPSGPMTGHHPIPVIVDSYFKGVEAFDAGAAYTAMMQSLSGEKDPDFLAYRKMGYVPFPYSESVTKTVEYAYDDWALAQFAGTVMRDQKTADRLSEKSQAYRRLFHTPTLFLLPRLGNEFITEPGNYGYKEGDKWIYSLFVPHDPVDLINRMGGSREFVTHLDSALKKKYIFFDNEPVFHVPYFFNYAGRPDKTQEWVREIMSKGYANKPDGLPGNDDLGSMSSWYVFSALGIFPFCPGRPVYDTGLPLFDEATIHLTNGKKFIIRVNGKAPGNHFVKNLKLNGSVLKSIRISHASVTEGGILEVTVGKDPAAWSPEFLSGNVPSETKRYSEFKFSGLRLPAGKIRSGQPFYAHFRLTNHGPQGTGMVRIRVDGKEIARKNVVAAENETVEDSLECTVYGSGRKSVQLGTLSSPLELLPDPPGKIQGAEVLALKVSPVCRVGEKSEIELLVVNKSSKTLTDTLEVTLDGSRFLEEIVTLESGVTRQINTFASLEKPGVHTITAGKISATIKIYAENRESSLLEISPGSLIPGDTIPDGSGFLNTGIVRNALKFDPDTGTSQPLADEYIEMRPSASLDRLKNKITVMTWVYPHKNRQLSDIISKGDHIVLQASAQTLTFFAGGWGRGVCESKLPDDWFGKWHHLAGVYDGNSLKLYIDGILSASETRLLPGNLLSFQRWMIMRNEEFPDIRHFKGKTDHLKIFAEPLNDDQIRAEMTENQPGN